MTHESKPASVTVWIEQLRAGDPDSASKLWERFFDRLVDYARRQLGGANRRVTDEEDIAAGVMAALCQCADRGKLPTLQNRDDLWRLLLAWTRHDVLDHVRKDQRLKRGAGAVRGDSGFENFGPRGDEQADRAPTAAALAEMEEQFRHLLDRLPDATLQQIAVDKMHGFTNEQIATRFAVTTRTIERKLGLIRRFWSEPENKVGDSAIE